MMFKRFLLLLLLVAVLVVPGAAFDYTQTFTGPFTWTATTGSDWNGPSWTFDLDYAMQDYEITWDLDLSGNSIASHTAHAAIRGRNSNGTSVVYARGGDFDHLNKRSSFEIFVGSNHKYAQGVYSANYDGSMSITRSGANHELWVGSSKVGGFTDTTDPLTSVTLYVERYASNPIVPGFSVGSVTIHGDAIPPPPPDTWVPCTINVYDADTRLPLSGSWDYYVVVQGADAVSGSASGAFKVVYLPATSILQSHLLRVTKEGYEHVGSPQMVAVPAGGCEIKVYLRDMQKPAAAGNVMVTFACTDADSGAPVHSALVNLNGTTAQYTGSSGLARFEVLANSTMQWVASSGNHWPMGGDLVVGTEDVTVPVALVRKTSDLPRPPLPELPNFPVIHPSLDPAGFRMQILSVPFLGSMAAPLLDTVDRLGVGVDEIADSVLSVLTLPATKITGAVATVGESLVGTATPYLVTSVLLLQVIGAVVSCIPDPVSGLVTFGLLLDIVRILLWGPA